MSFKDSIKAFEKKIQFQPVPRSKVMLEKGGYKINKWIINGAFIFMLFVFVYIAAIDFHFDFSPRIYFKCSQPEGCENPLYEGCNLGVQCSGALCKSELYKSQLDKLCQQSWVKQPYLQNGFEYGTKPSVLFQNINSILFLIFFFAFLTNHLIYNRGFSYEKADN